VTGALDIHDPFWGALWCLEPSGKSDGALGIRGRKRIYRAV